MTHGLAHQNGGLKLMVLDPTPISTPSQWLLSRADFFVPVEALSPIFRAKFRDALKPTDYFIQRRAGRCLAK